MKPEADTTPWPEAAPLPNAVICDLVYNPIDTCFLQKARAAGLPVIDGVGMLVHQGAKAFEYWTGYKPPTDVMRRKVIEGLAGRND